MIWTVRQVAGMIDNTNLKAYATKDDFRRLCDEAREYGFKSVAINTYPVRMCREMLEGSGVPHEFRTTAVKGLHSPADFEAIGRWLAGTERYFIQSYADSGDILAEGMAAFSREELEELLAAVRPMIPAAQLRGVD